MPSEDTQFTADNQPKKGRGKSKRTLYLEALASEMKMDVDSSEIEYYKFCIRVGMGLHQYFEENQDSERDVSFGRPDAQLLKDGMARLYPIAKATYPTYDFEFPEEGTMTEKADAIINAVGAGIVPIDAAKAFMDILETKASIFEKEELADRVAKLEELLSA